MRRILAFLLCATTVFAQAPSDKALIFAKDLRQFLAERNATDPMKEDWHGRWNDKEEAVFAHRAQTMKVYRETLQPRCDAIAKELGALRLQKLCTREHPNHLDQLAAEFEKAGRPQ